MSGFPGPDRNKSEHGIVFEYDFREKYDRVNGIYGCPDLVVPEIVPVTPPETTTAATTTLATTTVARRHHHQAHQALVPRTTAQTPNPPQTGSAVGPVQAAHEGDWTGLEVFGATCATLFFIYIGLNIGSALCLMASAVLDVWWPGKHKKTSQVLTHLGCFFWVTGVKTLGLINVLTLGKFFEALGLDPADALRHPLHDMPGRERLRAVPELGP